MTSTGNFICQKDSLAHALPSHHGYRPTSTEAVNFNSDFWSFHSDWVSKCKIHAAGANKDYYNFSMFFRKFGALGQIFINILLSMKEFLVFKKIPELGIWDPWLLQLHEGLALNFDAQLHACKKIIILHGLALEILMIKESCHLIGWDGWDVMSDYN